MSSSYQKTIWVDGDIITAQKLNNIENGIENIANQDSSDDSWIIGDGKTRFHISFPEGTPDARKKFAPFIVSDENTTAQVIIDWGDDTVETVDADSIQLHTYDNCENYIITIEVVSGSIKFSHDEDEMIRNYFIQSMQRKLKRFEIGNSVTSIGNGIFSNCINLTSVAIPNSVTSIGKNTFYNCLNLISITIPNSVTSINENTFSSCNNLTNITIPNSVTSIGDGAFSSCNNLANITIPDSITSIGNYTFAGCLGMLEYHLKSVVPPTLGNGTFTDIPSDCIIYVPEESVDTYKNATGWSTYADKIQAEPAA